MLNYFWNTATTNDCLVAGPSGAGYTRLNYWGRPTSRRMPAPPILSSAQRNAEHHRWEKVSRGTARALRPPARRYRVNDFGGALRDQYGALPIMGFRARQLRFIRRFLLGHHQRRDQLERFGAAVIAVEEAAGTSLRRIAGRRERLNTNQYVLVRPDHQFMLYRQAAGWFNLALREL